MFAGNDDVLLLMIMMTDEMLKLRQLRRKRKEEMLIHAATQLLSSSLKVDLPDDRLRHVFVLPRAAVHFLELDTMQTEQWDLYDEDLESQCHAGAQVALHVSAGLACCALLS